MNLSEYIRSAVFTEQELDAFLDPEIPSWGRFDPELGYVLGDCIVPDGIDGSNTFSSYGPLGERQVINHAEAECRINTYGDSMTQCHQVSDGETWQEYLAAHLGEPIRNFGVGGYGVYQAYRRLKRTEVGLADSELVILNVYSDDHTRSLDSWRWLRLGEWREVPRALESNSLVLVHGNPWPYVRLDLSNGSFVEFENPFPTEASLYDLCDPDFAYEQFSSDVVARLLLARDHGVLDGQAELDALAEALEIHSDWSDEEAIRNTAARIHDTYGQRASLEIMRWAQEFAEAHGRRLLFILTYEDHEVARHCESPGWRPDETFVAGVKALGTPTVDALELHRDDYRSFAISGSEYADRCFDGHYLPTGNHWFAFAIKDAVRAALDQPPPAYVDRGMSLQEAAARLA